MMFQLVALANYSQKVCVKSKLLQKKKQGENKTVVSNLAINVH